jgi:Iap family predicted aminopeptidase
LSVIKKLKGEGEMLSKLKVVSIVFMFVLSSLTGVTYSATAETWADKIAARIDINYAKYIVKYLTSLGSYNKPEFLGFRVAGTQQEYKAARFITDEMRKIGLENIAMEPVPVDAWEFSGAWLKVNGKTYPASSFGGVRGTGKKGITAEIVYVGKGLRPDYEKLKAEGVDVQGKLVLAYWSPDDVWVNMIGHEATLHGALGVVLFNPPGGEYAQAYQALHSFDGCYSSDFIPMIVISKEAAAEILDLMQKGPVTAIMVSLVKIWQGTGWNTVGYIPGTRHPDEFIIFADHHDAWFFGALDDGGGVAALMTLAKAIKDSGYQPDRTLVFITHTGEEYGLTDAYYDWLTGAWWMVTRAHPEWQSKAIVSFIYEAMAETGAPLETRANQELKAFLHAEQGKNIKLLPYGWTMGEVYCWNDQWPYVAAGIPSIYFAAVSDWYDHNVYHTQLDTIDLIDWSYLSNIIELSARIAIDLDQASIMPYNFETRANHLLDHLDKNLMENAGIDSTPILSAANEFLEVARTFNMLREKGISPEIADAVQKKIREAVRILLSNLTALDVWDYTIYPHEQVERDVTHLSLAIEALEKEDPTTAMCEIEWWISNNWYAPRVSYEVYKREVDRHLGPKQSFGEQAHLAPFIDLWQEYNSLAEKKADRTTCFGAEIDSLEIKYRAAVEVYKQRIEDITKTLNVVVDFLNEAINLCQNMEYK